jgi:hypothetical protein
MKRTPLEAYESLMRFARERGPAPLRMAMHAAVAQSFRPSFLHLIKLNFLPEHASDPAVESDVLCAPFCDEIGAGYYEFDPQTRALLIENLQAEYAGERVPRLESVAELLLAYLDEQEHSIDSTQDHLSQSYIEVERWIGLAILGPDDAAEQLAAALKQAVPGADAAARVNIGGVLNVLSTPLLRYPRLAEYALGVQALERGDMEKARGLFAGLGSQELQVGAVKLPPPTAVLERWGITGIESARETEPPLYQTCAVLGAYQDREYADRVVRIFSAAGINYGMHLFGQQGPEEDKVRELIEQQDVLVLILPELRSGILDFAEFALSRHTEVILLYRFQSGRFPTQATAIDFRLQAEGGDPERAKQALLRALELKEEVAAPAYAGESYRYDVYINNSPVDDSDGWVSMFAARLQDEIEKQLGAAVVVVRGGEDDAVESAVLVGILSRPYVESASARRALERYMSASQARGGWIVDGHNAIVPVLKEPMETRPAPFDEVVGFELYEPGSERQMQVLARGVAFVLARLRERAAAPTEQPNAVFVARTTADFQTERQRLIEILQEHGFPVITAAPARSTVASIHLLDAHPPDEQLNDLATATALGVPTFVWASSDSSDLETLSKKYHVSHMFHTSFGRFADEVVRTIRPRPLAKAAARTIFLACDEKDLTDTNLQQIARYLRDGGFAVAMTEFEGDRRQRSQADRDSMAISDAVILFYGAANDAFVRLYIRSLSSVAGGPLIALYISEPQNELKTRSSQASGLLALGDGGPFRPESLDPLLQRLESRRDDVLLLSDGTAAAGVERLARQLTAAGFRPVIRFAAPAPYEEYIVTILVCLGRGTIDRAFEARVGSFMDRGARVIPVLLPVERGPLTVYLSSTFRDLQTFRSAVAETLLKLEKRVVRMEDFVVSDEPVLQEIFHNIESSDIFIGIVAFQYGFVPPENNPKGLSMIELEYEHAVLNQKPCLMFLLDQDTPANPQFMDAYARDRIKAFRDRLRREKSADYFQTKDDLVFQVAVSVRNLEARREMEGLQLPDTLRSLHSVDLRQGDSDGFEKLVRAIRGPGSPRTA